MTSLRQNLIYAFRRFRSSPGFAAAVVVSIGLGIAANSTIFAMASRFVLQSAPVGDPGTLLTVFTTHDSGRCCNNFSWPTYTDVRDQAKSFSGAAAFFELMPASIGGSGEPERVWGQAATTNFFNVVQLNTSLGRGFSKDEERLPVIVLSYGLWQRRFGADPGITGRAILLSGRPFTVVGVAPRSFRGLDVVLNSQFWVPLANLDQLLPQTGSFQSRNYHWLSVAARLKPHVSPEQAAAELKVLAQRLAQSYPETDKGGGFHFEPAGSLPPSVKPAVSMFLGALSIVVLLVLCIACANVANLLLAQASGRQREMAVRLALGATSGQLLRQLLAESVLLALGGGLFGVFLSLWATDALSAFRLPAPVPFDLSLSVDWRVLLYTFALSLGTGLVFGLAPAWAAARPMLSNALKGEDALARHGSRLKLRNILVVAQIGMSLVLLCATGLFLRSLESASHIDIGFRSKGILMMSVDPKLHGYSAERTVQFLTELRQRVAALPGVISAAGTDVAPLSGGHRSDGFSVEGRTGSESYPSADLFMASPGYLDTLGIPLVAGRDFRNESAAVPTVAIVNQAFAQSLFPHENAIGRRVSGGGATYEIIGVTKNIKSRFLGEEPRPVVFRSLAQTIARDPSMMGYSLLVHYAGDSGTLARAVRREIRALDPTLAIFNAETMEEHFHNALFLARLAAALFGVFGITGLVLAAVGLYGVMSYSVSRRTREIGIRLALGAQAGGVQRLIVGQGMRLTLIAVAIGLAGALAAAKFSAAILYGVRPHDLATFTAVPLFLAVVAFLACWIPSRRAARVDPITALRYE